MSSGFAKHPPAIVVRRAETADIPALVGLLKLLFGLERDFVFSQAKQERGLLLLLGSSQAAVLTAEENGSVMGMCTGQLLVSTAEGGPAVLVEDVVVAPAWQGRGVGRQLLLEMGRWAVEQGANRIQLLADRSNSAALAFYQETGFGVTNLICLRKMLYSLSTQKQFHPEKMSEAAATGIASEKF